MLQTFYRSIQTHVYSLAAVSLAAAILVGLVVFNIPSGVSAQESNSDIEMGAYPAFEGNFKYGEWLPVWVELENNGPDLETEVRIQVTSSGGAVSYALPVSLPTVSRKRVSLYVLPNNFSRELDVQLVSGDQLLVSQKVQLEPQPPIAYFVGLAAAERGALSLLNGIELPGQERPKTLVDIRVDDLPERFEGLRSFDTLILNDVDTSSFTPEQVVALENWVVQGGRLVIGGGAGAQRTTSGLPASLLPLAPTGTEEVDNLPGLAEFADEQEIRVPGPFIIATGDLQNGHILASQENMPLVIEHPVANGYVDFIALDLSVSPFDAWSGATNFWENILGPGAAYPDWLPPDMSARQQISGQMPYALSNLPMLDLPSVQGLAVLLGFYIILVGPVNYLVLRWQRRLHLAWVTIPVITLIFSAGAFGLGYILHGTDLFLNKIAIISLHPSGRATVNSYMGLFSPGQQAYEIEVQGSGLLSPLQESFYDPWSAPPGINADQEMVIVQGDTGYLHGLNINQWSMQSFMSEGMPIEFGKIRADLRLEGDAITGSVINESDYEVTDAVIILGKTFVRLDDLAPRTSTQVNMNLDLAGLSELRYSPPISYMIFEDQFNNPGTGDPQREAEMKRIILESVLERGSSFSSMIDSRMPTASGSSLTQGPILLGWMDEAPPELTISGQAPAQQTTALIYMPLSYQLPEQGKISIPIGLIPGSMTKQPFDGGTCGEPGVTAVYLGQGEAHFDFMVPQNMVDLEVEHIKLSIDSDGGWWNSPTVAMYDWQSDTWQELTDLSQGVNLVPNSSSYKRPDGLIKVSLSGDGNNQGCYYIALGLEGWRE